MTAIILAGGLRLSLPAWPVPSASPRDVPPPTQRIVDTLPYQQAGLSARQAAAHLLNRLAFGARPGEVEQLVHNGLEKWVEEQLRSDLVDPELEERLKAFPSLALEASELRRRYPFYQALVNSAASVGIHRPENPSEEQQREYNLQLRDFQLAHGITLINDMFDDLRNQKIIRAVYARNQLREVLADFWFNHFNVSATEGQVQHNVLDYERSAIRPYVLGSFQDMVFATAHHPAMLFYLNNNQSSSAPTAPTMVEARLGTMTPEDRESARKGQPGRRKNGGINENYARELMELHTLGVDGGYTQQDVTEVSRALSGWTVWLSENNNPNLHNLVDGNERLGYVRRGDFLFRADWHDAGAKQILGVKFPPGRGVEEGEQVLRLLSSHPSTARYVSRKLAQRFVADEPPERLVQQMADRFSTSRGQIREVLRAMVYSPEFWASHRQGKVKSPFELVCSTLRACGAEVVANRNQADWVTRLGEPLYQCPPPTGYPENSRFWMAPGMLVNRLNFAQSVILNRVGGVRVELDRLARLTPGCRREEIVAAMAANFLPGAEQPALQLQSISAMLQEAGDGYPASPAWFAPKTPADLPARRDALWRQRLAGVILGCPEFQRR